MPKDTLTPKTSTPDPYWLEVRRFAASIAAHPKLNATAKFVGIWLLFNYASREKFLAEGTLQVWPAVATLARQCALSTDQVDAALKGLKKVGALMLVSRGRGKNNSTKRVFCTKFAASVSPKQLGDNRTGPNSYHRVHSDVSPKQLGDTPTLSPREFGTTYRSSNIDIPPDARASGAPGGGGVGVEATKVAEPVVPRRKSKSGLPRQTTRSEGPAIVDDALRGRYDAVMSETLFKVNQNSSREKLISHHVRKLRAQGYSAEIILAVARSEARKVETRRLQDRRYRAPLPMVETQMQRCEELVIQREAKQRRERERAEEETQRQAAAAAKEAARERFIGVLRPIELAYYERQGRSVAIDRIDRSLSERFDTLRFAVLDLKTGKATEEFKWGESIGWRTDHNVPQTIDDLVEAAKRFADRQPNERPEIEPMAAILSEIVNERLEYVATRTSAR